MLPSIPTPTTQFSLHYDAADHILRGCWLPRADDHDLYPAYAQLLAAAKQHGNCRYWLLDMQKRPWHSVSFAAWFGDFLANQVVREVGAPIFVAYVADERHRSDIEGVATQALLKQTAQFEFYPYFFNDVAAARDWLVYYQAHPCEQPPQQRP